MSRRHLTGLLTVIAALVAAYWFANTSGGDRSADGVAVRSDTTVQHRAADQATGVASQSRAGKIRLAYIEAPDLKALHDQLFRSNEPGALLYANLARAECLIFSNHFGLGASAWEKFHQQAPESAPDRAQRVEAFQRQVSRCAGFDPGTTAGVLAFAKVAFDPDSRDPWVRLSVDLLKAGTKPQNVSDTDFAALASSALVTRDPELIEQLGKAVHARSSPRDRGPDAFIAESFAWGAAIEMVVGDAPLSIRSQQVAVCITGNGCEPMAALDAAARTLWDQPPNRAEAIIARAKALAPRIQAALESGSVEAVLAVGAPPK